jgi:prevent-host-death family protein
VAETPLLTESFAQAKARLSELMTEVVHGHHPLMIDRHHGKERALLLSAEDLSILLASFHFQPLISVSEGEFVARLPELGLVAGGESYEKAMDELLDLIEQYTDDYFDRWDFFRQTDRAGHAPWLMRFALTPTDQRPALLTEAPPAQEIANVAVG